MFVSFAEATRAPKGGVRTIAMPERGIFAFVAGRRERSLAFAAAVDVARALLSDRAPARASCDELAPSHVLARVLAKRCPT